MGGAGDGRLRGRPVPHLPVVAQVAGGIVPHQRCAVGAGSPEGGGRGQILVVDVDQGGGLARLVAGLGDHDGDDFAHVAHLADGHRRVRRLVHG